VRTAWGRHGDAFFFLSAPDPLIRSYGNGEMQQYRQEGRAKIDFTDKVALMTGTGGVNSIVNETESIIRATKQ